MSVFPPLCFALLKRTSSPLHTHLPGCTIHGASNLTSSAISIADVQVSRVPPASHLGAVSLVLSADRISGGSISALRVTNTNSTTTGHEISLEGSFVSASSILVDSLHSTGCNASRGTATRPVHSP
jgi:hypothetical protein